MTDEVRVREAQPGDEAAIRAVTLGAYEQYAGHMRAHWEGYRRNILDTLAAPGPAQRLVAEDAGAIVGSVILYPPGTVGITAGARPIGGEWPEVRLLAVDPAVRGRGVGLLLMQACVDRARAAGAAALALHTTDMMASAMRLYERMGFERAPELDFQPAPGIIVKGFLLALDRPSRQAL